MSFKNQYNYWNRKQPQPDPNTPGTPGEPDDEEK
jgi:hypothetical protein